MRSPSQSTTWRRRERTRLPRDFWLRRLEQLDPEADCAEIYGIIVRHEFPWDLNQSLSFALFRTYAVPSIGVLRERLPEVARVRIEDLAFGVVHETGQKTGREQRCDALYPDLDVLVFGHSHIPWDTTTPHGLRLLNPGSPTDRRRQPHGTYLTALVDGSALRAVSLHALPR